MSACVAHLHSLPGHQVRHLARHLPALVEVDLAALPVPGTPLVQEVQVLDEQAEEGDHNLGGKGGVKITF